MKVLIVEDESIVSFDIQNALESFGYEVTNTVENYDDAINSIKEEEPQLILMDIHLENSKDGIETATHIKKIKDIPIIYLTAFCDDNTIDRAIKTNPLAYMLKPFNRNELKLTLRLSQHKLTSNTFQNNSQHTLLGNGYSFDMHNNHLYFNDIPIKLSNKEEMLLTLLLDARNNIVSFSDIEHHLWPDKVVANSTLRSVIFRLRSKLEHKCIQTVPNFGCRINIK